MSHLERNFWGEIDSTQHRRKRESFSHLSTPEQRHSTHEGSEGANVMLLQHGKVLCRAPTAKRSREGKWKTLNIFSQRESWWGKEERRRVFERRLVTVCVFKIFIWTSFGITSTRELKTRSSFLFARRKKVVHRLTVNSVALNCGDKWNFLQVVCKASAKPFQVSTHNTLLRSQLWITALCINIIIITQYRRHRITGIIRRRSHRRQSSTEPVKWVTTMRIFGHHRQLVA